MPKIRADGDVDLGGFNEPIVEGDGIGDASDESYIDFPSGSGNATVGLALPAGIVGTPIALHLRMRVLVDDPLAFTGEGEVFLNTSADGGSATEFASFSNGAGGGFSFNLPAEVAAETVEMSVPLRLGPQWPTTLADVQAALAVGAFLDFNAWDWTGGSDEPIFRVFEAWLAWPQDVAVTFSGSGSLTVTASRVATAAMTRQWPRDDGRGLSSGPRLFPPPKSRRLVGGHQ